MVNLFLNAVTKQLGTTFGDKYRYYVEDVEQGLKKPCFTVDLLIPLQRSKSPILYDRTMPIVIHYFSDSTHNLKNDCYAMGERIVECLEYLPIDKYLLGRNSLGDSIGSTPLRGEDISYQIVDDVLQVFITYRFTTKKVVDMDEVPETLEASVTNR